MTVCAHGSGDYVKKDDVDVAIAKAAGKLASDLIGTSLKPGDPKIGELIDIILRAMRPEFFPLNKKFSGAET